MYATVESSKILLKSTVSLNQRIIKLNCTLVRGTCTLGVSKPVKGRFLIKTNSKVCLPLFTKNFSSSLEICNDEVCRHEFQNHKVVTDEEKPIIFEDIADGDPKILKRLKVIDFEIQMFRDQFYKIPNALTKIQYEELLEYNTVDRRLKYLNFLFLREKKKENDETKKKIKIKQRMEHLDQLAQEGKKIYTVGNSSYFIRIYEKTLHDLMLQRQLAAQMFSQTIVFDFSYQSYMSRLTSKSCANQIVLSYLENVQHLSPFAIKFCNYDRKSLTVKYLERFSPSFARPNHPWDFHSESYLDLFPREKLVYLTPHCKNPLQKWSHDDVYIIGAFVDRGTSTPASRVKATQDKIRMASLPLEYYVKWKQGDKALPLNIVLNILLDMRYYNDWTIAFKNLPERKISGFYNDVLRKY